MKELHYLQTFALNKDGTVVHVADVDNGKACNCHCSACGSDLIAKQGTLREWHFAHHGGAECRWAAETNLHLAAKEMIFSLKKINVPDAAVNVNYTLPNGTAAELNKTRRVGRLKFDKVEMEKKYDEFRADVVGFIDNVEVCIEIAVTHLVDEDKAEKMVRSGFPAFEVVLNIADHEVWGWTDIHKAVIEETRNKKWILPLMKDELTQEANEEIDIRCREMFAEIERKQAVSVEPELEPVDEAQSDVPETKPQRKLIREGKIMGSLVRVNYLGFGYSVWWPYSDLGNLLLKRALKKLPSRYNPRYKNWLVTGVKEEAMTHWFDTLLRVTSDFQRERNKAFYSDNELFELILKIDASL